MSQQVSTNTFGCAKWIVSSDATQGTHTTIAAALTSASSGDTIFIRPGTYTENLTLKAGVDICAFICDAQTPNVTIVGKVTASYSGTVTISGIRFQTNSDNAIYVTGSNATILYLKSCFIYGNTNNVVLNLDCTNASSKLWLYHCTGDLNSATATYLSNSGTGNIKLFHGNFDNNIASTTASTISSSTSGSLTIVHCVFSVPITTSNSSQIECEWSELRIVTHNGTGTGTILHSSIIASSSSAVSVGTGATLSMYNCSVSSSNTNAITGLGTINFGNIVFTNSSSTVNTTTQNALPIGFASAGGTGTVTSDALKSYEEGTFTPILNFGGATTGITYSNQLGSYVKIGKMVCIVIRITLSNKGSATGVATITGIPFATLNTTSLVQELALTTKGNITYTGISQLIGIMANNSTTINLDSISTAGAQAALTDTLFANNSDFAIQGIYISNT